MIAPTSAPPTSARLARKVPSAFDPDWQPRQGGGGTLDYAFVTYVDPAVPEPSTGLILGVGMIALAALRKLGGERSRASE
jgi:hypothetical protein